MDEVLTDISATHRAVESWELDLFAFQDVRSQCDAADPALSYEEGDVACILYQGEKGRHAWIPMPVAAASLDATASGACLGAVITNATQRAVAHDLTNAAGLEGYWAGWWLEDCANLAALASGDVGGRFGEQADGTAWPEG